MNELVRKFGISVMAKTLGVTVEELNKMSDTQFQAILDQNFRRLERKTKAGLAAVVDFGSTIEGGEFHWDEGIIHLKGKEAIAKSLSLPDEIRDSDRRLSLHPKKSGR